MPFGDDAAARLDLADALRRRRWPRRRIAREARTEVGAEAAQLARRTAATSTVAGAAQARAVARSSTGGGWPRRRCQQRRSHAAVHGASSCAASRLNIRTRRLAGRIDHHLQQALFAFAQRQRLAHLDVIERG